MVDVMYVRYRSMSVNTPKSFFARFDNPVQLWTSNTPGVNRSRMKIVIIKCHLLHRIRWSGAENMTK